VPVPYAIAELVLLGDGQSDPFTTRYAIERGQAAPEGGPHHQNAIRRTRRRFQRNGQHQREARAISDHNNYAAGDIPAHERIARVIDGDNSVFNPAAPQPLGGEVPDYEAGDDEGGAYDVPAFGGRRRS
jgi:hypothetical protein